MNYVITKNLVPGSMIKVNRRSMPCVSILVYGGTEEDCSPHFVLLLPEEIFMVLSEPEQYSYIPDSLWPWRVKVLYRETVGFLRLATKDYELTQVV